MGLQQPGFSGGWMKMRDTIPFFIIIYDYERTLFFFLLVLGDYGSFLFMIQYFLGLCTVSSN